MDESDSISENTWIIMIAVGIACAYFINKKKARKNIRVQVRNKQTQTDIDPFDNFTQNKFQDHCNKQTQTEQQDNLVPIIQDEKQEEKQNEQIKTDNVTDVNSAMKNNYDIISIQNVASDICCLYPHLKNGYTIIASQLQPHIIYFFNPWESIHYKYDYITKQWNTICNLDDEHDFQYSPQCFHLNPKKGLIGVFDEKETKLRIYDEMNDEWSTSTIEIELKSWTLALDTKNMIYHLVDYGKRHFTYNLNTFEFLQISKKIPFRVSPYSKYKDKLLYNKYTHSLIYLSRTPLKNNIFEFNIEKQIWQEFRCKINNFEPGNWTETYQEFGCICVHNMNKILTFGGNFHGEWHLNGAGAVPSKYIFELDLDTKTWSILNPDRYSFEETFNIGACFIESHRHDDDDDNDDTCQRVHVFDTDWSKTGSCNHVIMDIKCGEGDIEQSIMYAPNSISVKLPMDCNYESDTTDDTDLEFKFDDEIKNNCALVPTDIISEGIAILKGNTYNIKSIDISTEISRHNVSDCCIVESVFDTNILYFFNADYKDFKYNLKTKKWKRIKEMDKKYQVTGCRAKNAFYLDPNNGLIGITGDWDITDTIRIYNELTDAWDYQQLATQKLNLKSSSEEFKIPRSGVVFDSKNKMYHILFSKHITYNLDTKEWKEMLRTSYSPVNGGFDNHCLIYNKHNETIFYIREINKIHCYNIKNDEWKTEKLKCENFVPFGTSYTDFGAVHLNGLHKILTFGGKMSGKKINYMFELDLNRNCWKLLDPNIYKLPRKMCILCVIPHNIGDGRYRIDILNRVWRGADGNKGQYVFEMYIDEYNENKKYYSQKLIMPTRIKEIRKDTKKKEVNKKNICVPPFEKKSGVVVCGYMRNYFGNDIDEHVLKTISFYFCFGLVDFNGVWEIKHDEYNSKHLYGYEEFEDQSVYDMEFLETYFVGYIHAIEHDLYENTIKMKSYFSFNTNSCGVIRVDENIDSDDFEEIKEKSYRQTKWTENKTELLTKIFKNENTQYTVQRYINENKYFLKISDGEHQILREYHKSDKESVPDTCMIM